MKAAKQKLTTVYFTNELRNLHRRSIDYVIGKILIHILRKSLVQTISTTKYVIWYSQWKSTE